VPSEPPEATSGAPADPLPEYDDIFDPLLAYVSAPQEDGSGEESVPLPPTRRSPLARPRMLSLESVLAAGILCVAGALVYSVIERIKAPPIAAPALVPTASPVPQPVSGESRIQGSPVAREEPADDEGPEPAAARTEPLSLQIAQKYYLSADYGNAFIAYDKLNRHLSATSQNQPVKDFLLLRMALCSRGGGNTPQADTMFRAVALSRLPVLRAIARYYQSITLIDRQRYLEAATRAYQTIALIEVVDCDAKWSAMVRRQCCFLAAEALTRHLLSLQGADAAGVKELWGGYPQIDPFVDLDEGQLRFFLGSGRQTLDQALLGPQIRPVSSEGETPRWSVICDGAPLEELLARFASNARINVRWMDSRQTADEQAGRQRPVYLYLARATAQQVVTTAASSVGLLARVDENGSVTILDPSSYSSITEYTKLLADESASLWQRFLLGSEADQRVPNGHFALAMIHAARDRPDEAVAEYKLVASRFSGHALAPQALLRSGRLKVQLRDYLGAHEDFKRLVELYPDAESSERACLELADVTVKAGLYEEAAGLYRKVFNLGLSLDSQIGSALGAGRCFYEMKDYEAAAQWLNRYIMLARDQKRLEFHGACLLLGKTYLALGNLPQARAALNLALQGELSREQLVETFATLAGIYLQQGLFIDALNVLEGTQAWQLSQQETVDLLLLRARALRAIGLAEKAITVLADKSSILPSPELKGAIALELAECYATRDKLTQAIGVLGDTLALVPPGDLAQQIGAKLAGLCLRANHPEQAISVCTQLLDSASDAQREYLLTLQAEAYRRQRQYDRAVAALLSRHHDPALWKPTEAGVMTEGQQQE
jgi:tetratricopeptide (TPR) repeat protein